MQEDASKKNAADLQKGGKIAMDIANKIKQGLNGSSHIHNAPAQASGKGMGQ
jgi:hypothetical protein